MSVPPGLTWWRVETHCHTNASPDGLNTPAEIVAAARRRGLDRLIITDHNTIAGALQARDLAPDLVIVGEEVMTQSGEILAFFVREEVPAGLPAEEAIARLRDQGAVLSIAHPFDRLRKGHWAWPDLLRVLPLVDAVEVFNARAMWPGSNRQAQRFASQHGLPGTAGSDAHSSLEVGRAVTLLPPFTHAAELRQGLSQARWQGRVWGLWVHLISRYARYRQR